MENYKNVTHCLFDMDGLLLDTEDRYTMAFNEVLSEFGDDKKFGWNEKAPCMGLQWRESCQFIIDRYNLPLTPELLSDKLRPVYERLFPQSQLLPGAERLLSHLYKHKIPFALATSSSEASYELKTKQVKPMFELFHHRVLGGSDPDVKNGKPAPDIFLVAASRFPDNPDPSKCLVFEDAPNGVQAAVSAGMQVCMVPDKNLPKDLTKKATKVMGSLLDFKPEEFGLPPFDD